MCEKILRESDGVLSVIRIVDVFTVPNVPRAYSDTGTEVPIVSVNAHGCLLIKANPGRYEHMIQFKLQNAIGEIVELGPAQKTALENQSGLEDLPSGLALDIGLGIGPVKHFGTCYFLVFLDGEEAARVPFTLRPSPVEKSNG